jgi:hypothetical protein
MPTAPQQPHDLLKRINAWALNDIGFDCAMATGCTAPALPRNQKALWSLLADKHADFFNKATEHGSIDLGPTTHHNTASYNPTERCGYHHPGDDHPDTLAIRAAAKEVECGGSDECNDGTNPNRHIASAYQPERRWTSPIKAT